jgi:hypothetical protein
MGNVSIMEPLGNQVTSRSIKPYTGIGSSAGADSYFSRTRGTEMDTNVNKPRQGASAGLSRQEPHTEVVEKTSATSSSEERLAAGISTIGLQTERLSGAQWKKLMREKR